MNRKRRSGRNHSKGGGRSGNRSGNGAGGPQGAGTGRCGHCRFPVTRQYGLLLRDQDILDLIWRCTLSEVDVLAGQFVAVQDAIDQQDLAVIEQVAKESPEFLFRRIMGAIKRGVIDKDWWCAGYTTRVIIGEAFSKTPDYFRALRYYCDDLRLERRRAGG
ncbi:MAG TPA: hypothetical protein VJX67_00880 [Blastocatellia bacterium]|nr:hypothetical protein [Blastocatellia bacterium]